MVETVPPSGSPKDEVSFFWNLEFGPIFSVGPRNEKAKKHY